MTAASKTMSNEKQASEAVALKEAGNQCYKNSDVPGALENYTKAIGTFENKSLFIKCNFVRKIRYDIG